MFQRTRWVLDTFLPERKINRAEHRVLISDWNAVTLAKTGCYQGVEFVLVRDDDLAF